MTTGRRYIVDGRVQGVGFRAFTEHVARVGRLRGFVRNRPDGSVEIEAEGDVGALQAFERAIRSGPPGARVDAVRVETIAVGSEHRGFAVRG